MRDNFSLATCRVVCTIMKTSLPRLSLTHVFYSLHIRLILLLSWLVLGFICLGLYSIRIS